MVVRRARELAVEVLHDDRHAAERTVGQVALGRGARPLEQRMDHRVHVVVQRFDARDRGVDQLDRLRVAAANERGLVGGVEIREIGHAG